LKNDIYRVIILPDLQTPYHDSKTLSAVEKFMADYRWDEYVNLGDLMDFDMLSSFNKESLRQLESRRIMKDYELANSILDRHQKIVRSNNKKAKFTLLEGNHENRLEKAVDKLPSLEGLVEVESNLKLAERGFKWVRSWSRGELHKIGKLHFSHGKYTTKYHAAKMVDTYGVNIVYGHTHDVQSYARTILGKDKSIKAQSLGHLADEAKLAYMKNGPSNWLQAIAVAEIRKDGAYNLYPIEIINHTFTFNNRTYAP
jgi:predicted phosphodiesterase